MVLCGFYFNGPLESDQKHVLNVGTSKYVGGKK